MGFVVMGSERTSFEVTQRLRRLWIAVLHQAIEDARGNVRSVENQEVRIGGIQREALTWIFNDELAKRDLVPLALREREVERETGMPVNGIFRAANSFDSVCLLLDIDPDWARHRLSLVPEIRRGLDSAGLQAGRKEVDPC